jgi:uncharacterized protein YidB (DUF937 family)
MGLLDSILSAVSGRGDTSSEGNQLLGVLSGFLRRAVACKAWPANFLRAARATHFRPGWLWVKTSRFPPIKIQEALGSGQIRAIATKMGVDPNLASQFLAEYLPKIVDKLTPTGKVDPTVDHQQGLAALLPSLLQSLDGKPGGDQSAQA